MKRQMIRINVIRLTMLFLVVGLASTTVGQHAAESNWPSFRGPQADGTSTTAKPPTEWSESKNVRWKIDLPGGGNSSPIVWGDKVIVISAIAKGPATAQPRQEGGQDRGRGRGRGRGRRGSSANMSEHDFKVFCINRKTGEKIWEKTAVTAKPHAGHHRDHGHVSASPCTDGKHIYAHFGSRGLYCYDMDGNLKWKRTDFGQMQTRRSFGEGSSPTLHDETLFVPWDHEGQSMLYAINKNTGKDRWKIERDEPTNWISPIVVKANGKLQVVQGGQDKCRGYDYETGKELWSWSGLTDRPCATPVANDNVVIFASAKGGASMSALKFDMKGNLNRNDGSAWSIRRSTPDIPSPMLLDGQLYFVGGNSGALTAADVESGEITLNTMRLPSIRGVYSSPVAADGKIYVTGRGGTTVVISAGDDNQVIQTNKLDDAIDATLALSGDEIFVRGKKTLYCIGEKE